MPHLLVVGAGPGAAAAAARRLGRDGYAVSLVARREDALTDLASALRSDGVPVGWAVADAGDADGLTGLAESSARWWLPRKGTVSRDEAVALMSALAWRGISGFPRVDGGQPLA